MSNLMETSWDTVLTITLSAIGIYISVVLFTRLAGKRSFSKMSSFDFAMTVAVGSIIASTLLSSSVKLIEGIVGLGIVYVLQMGVAILRRNSLIQNIVDNKPPLLMRGEKILHSNLQKARVTHGDLRSKLREANVTQLSQVKAVVFETTGDISVLHKEDNSPMDTWILEDVQLK